MDPGEHSDRQTPAQRPTLPEGRDLPVSVSQLQSQENNTQHWEDLVIRSPNIYGDSTVPGSTEDAEIHPQRKFKVRR